MDVIGEMKIRHTVFLKQPQPDEMDGLQIGKNIRIL
jgi:hypothetical protein